jgi:hypothetical protein
VSRQEKVPVLAKEFSESLFPKFRLVCRLSGKLPQFPVPVDNHVFSSDKQRPEVCVISKPAAMQPVKDIRNCLIGKAKATALGKEQPVEIHYPFQMT